MLRLFRTAVAIQISLHLVHKAGFTYKLNKVERRSLHCDGPKNVLLSEGCYFKALNCSLRNYTIENCHC